MLALSLLFVSSGAFASDAQGFIQGKQTELVQLLKQGKSSAVEQKIEGIFDNMLDYETLAKESLKDHWSERSEQERAEFKNLLKQLVQRAYQKNLRKTLDYEIEYKGEAKAKHGILVRTVAKHRTDARTEPISVDYVLHKVDGRWLIYDIVTEGSSLVNNYRSQFRRIIKKKGFADLMRRMRDKVESQNA